MILAIDARKRDVAFRLNENKVKREERQEKIDQDRERTERRNEALAEAAEKFKAEQPEPEEAAEGEAAPEVPVFDEKYFLFHYDEEHPETLIPGEVAEDKDHDWFIPENQIEEVIEIYLQG